MNFQIKKVILWPKDQRILPRVLDFELGKLNIITGASRTGKSAIIPIIDYCLGSDSCSIPVTTIRDACSWFGVLIKTSNGEKLFARQEPGDNLSSGDMYFLEGITVDIPLVIDSKNIHVSDAKIILNHISGLTNLDFDLGETGSGFLSRPSFRDLSAFNFQPQNLIANPDVLFYKADTYAHREKLKNIFPYVLGAESAETLALRHELAHLKKEFKKKFSELQAVKNVSERWVSEIKAQFAEAKELGLLDITYTWESSKDEMIKAFKKLISSPRAQVEITEQTITESVEELEKIKKEESSLSSRLFELKRRFSEMSDLKHTVPEFKDTLTSQIERLKITDWLLQHTSENCPICGNEFTAASNDLHKLQESLLRLEHEKTIVNVYSPSFDREYERVREEISQVTENIRGLQIRRNALEKSSDEFKQNQYETVHVERFIGRLATSLEIYESLGTDGDLQAEVDVLQARIKEISRQLSDQDIKQRLENSISKINQFAGRLLPNLDVERPNDPVLLKIDDLTIQVKSEKRSDYLWEIGSGSNWLSYHVAMLLALHQFFLENKSNPVPSFLVIDQPSQVYFPKRLVDRKKESDSVDFSAQFQDEDAIAVRKVFEVISDVLAASKGGFQVIVLDHAAENIWGGISGVHLVDEWRNGKKLVPQQWLTVE